MGSTTDTNTYLSRFRLFLFKGFFYKLISVHFNVGLKINGYYWSQQILFFHRQHGTKDT